MSATNQFRMEAEVVDKFTRPIRDFQHALSAINAPKNAEQIRKEFDAVQRSVARAGEAIGGGLRRALGGLGIASMSASIGLAAAFSAVKNFSSSLGEMRAVSKETGFSLNMLRTLDAAARQFQIAPDTVRAGLKTFASNIYDFRRQFGSTYAEVLKYAPDLAASLKEASPDKAVEIAIDYLSRVENRISAGRISELLFGTSDIARFGQDGPEKLRAALLEVRKRIGEIDPNDDAKARAFSSAVKQINNSMEGLKRTITIELAPSLAEFAGWADRFVKQNKDQIKDGLVLTFTAISSAARSVNDIVDNSIGWDLLIKGILLAKIGETAGGLVKFGAGFAILGRSVSSANLTGLLAILSGLAAVGLAFGAFRSGGAGSTPSPAGAAEAKGPGDAGSQSAPPPAANDKGASAKSEARLGSAVQDGVAKGIVRGLEAVAGVGANGSGGGSGGGLGGSGSSGMSMLRNAISRGRGSISADGVVPLGGQGPVRADLRSKAMRVMARLVALGWTPEAAASAVGQFTVEGFDENSGVLYRGGDKGKAHGIGQWHPDRWAQYLAFAQARAKKLGVAFKANDIDAQVDFFNEERKRRSKAEASWHKETDLRRGERLGWMYERYGSGTSGKRLGWSQRWLEEWRKGKEDVPKPIEKREESAFKSAKEAGFVGENSKGVPLFVRIHGAPKSTRINVDPGSGFTDAKVMKERGDK